MTPPRAERLFSSRATVALALLLGVPFVVRTLTNVEPFPALLFPAGAVKVPVVEGHALFPYFLAYARTPSGLTRLDPGELLLPLPAHYFFDIATRTLGQSSPKQEVAFKHMTKVSVPRYVATPEERREVTLWLSRRVRERCPGATELVLRPQAARFDLAQHRLSSSRTENEIVIPLG